MLSNLLTNNASSPKYRHLLLKILYKCRAKSTISVFITRVIEMKQGGRKAEGTLVLWHLLLQISEEQTMLRRRLEVKVFVVTIGNLNILVWR